jgi:hypothetical protein
MDTSDREPESLRTGPPPEAGPVRTYTWEWGREEDRQPELPWIGIFLVVLGGLLLIDQALPEYRGLGNVVVLAAGLAFLVLWALRRGTFSLYAGTFLTASAIPALVEEATGNAVGPGFGTLCYGLAFLFVAAVRFTRAGGIGWQALIGALLVVLGGSQMALPNLAAVVFPALIVVFGIVLLTRGSRETRR